jgi:F0F1-type ATP synthase assembly protein I
MKKFKKILLYITGPGMVFVILTALLIQIFTETNAKSWIIGALVVFFVVFIPVYFVIYFRQNLKESDTKKSFHFKKRDTRTEWEGGNIHGKIPTEAKRPGKFFR